MLPTNRNTSNVHQFLRVTLQRSSGIALYPNLPYHGYTHSLMNFEKLKVVPISSELSVRPSTYLLLGCCLIDNHTTRGTRRRRVPDETPKCLQDASCECEEATAAHVGDERVLAHWLTVVGTRLSRRGARSAPAADHKERKDERRVRSRIKHID